MKKLMRNKYLIDFLILFIPLLLIEIVFRVISGYSLGDMSLIRIGLGVAIISTLVTFITSFCNNLVTRIIQAIVVIAASIYASLQLGFFNFIGVYISFQESSQLGAVKDYILDFFRSFKKTYFIPLAVIVLYLTVAIVFRKSLKNLNKVSFKMSTLVTSLLLVVCGFLYYGTLTLKAFDSKFQMISNKNLFLTVSNTTNSVTKFGTTAFSILDLRQKFFPITITDSFVLANINNNYREVDDIKGISDQAWAEINENTTNEEYKNINNYFMYNLGKVRNEYTGIYKGKNVIFILLESVNDVIIQYPELYPNFHKIMSEGWYFENNYSPRNSCATLNNEFSGMTSLYSIANICTGSKYKDNSYFQSVFNLYNKEGYTTFSAHDYTDAYYPRREIHPNMGSQQYYGVQDLGIPYSNEYINWANDDDFMKKVMEIIETKRQDNDKFMAWLTTVSSHQPYLVSSIQGNEYLDLTEGMDIPMDVRRYMSKLKYVDNALGILLDGLEKQGILDDTVLVLYGDHYPYGIPTNNLNEVLDYDTSVDKNAERVPFIIYNSTMEGKVFSQYTTYINILPTISNLFSLDYEADLMMGSDLLDSNYESIVIFADGTWKNENAYYEASTGKVTKYNDVYTEEDIYNITNRVNARLALSEKIIKTDYFRYLESMLETVEDSNISPVVLGVQSNLCEVTLSSEDDGQTYE